LEDLSKMRWPAHLTIEQLAQAAGVPLSQVRRWVRFRVIVPAARDGRRHLFLRQDAVLGAVLRRLQRLVGVKSRVPLAVARELRPLLATRLRQGFVGPVDVAVAGWELKIGAAELNEVNARLDTLMKETR
jgi:DNA-binding transcriptional MerR regulator